MGSLSRPKCSNSIFPIDEHVSSTCSLVKQWGTAEFQYRIYSSNIVLISYLSLNGCYSGASRFTADYLEPYQPCRQLAYLEVVKSSVCYTT
jgi:hypothetical protein